MSSSAALEALNELLARDDPSILGLVLSGSAARGMETERSDVDVFVVRAESTGRETRRSTAIDEIPDSLVELEDVSPYGSAGWWGRWSYAYAEVLRDDTGGRITAAVRRLSTVDATEQRAILVDHDRLDGWVNFAYRSLKSNRDGRPLESRLDAVESVPWLMDVVFTLAGRVRPYNKYLPWELREHPLAASTPSPYPSGRRRSSYPRSSECSPATQPHSVVPSPSSTARSAPGTPPTARPSAATTWTRGATSSPSSLRSSGREVGRGSTV